MTKLTVHIQTFFANLKKAAQEDKDAKYVDELMAHVTDSGDREIYRTILKNQISFLRAQTAAEGKGKCPKCGHELRRGDRVEYLLPKITTRVLDNLVVMRGWLGIQPMQAPVGLVYTLQYRDQENGKTTLEILSQAVEARSLKLSAAWTIEAMADLKEQHDIDIESEMVQALASEIATEIIESHLHNIRSLGKVKGNVPVKTYRPESVDVHRGDWLSVLINKEANNIARDTRRGAGNFVVVSPTTLATLQTSKNFVKTTTESGEFRGPASVLFAGILNETIRVYVDIFTPTDEILVGYKGGSGDVDTGYIYCPYIILMNSGIVVNPTTFQPTMGMMTREGKMTTENAANYYSTFAVNLKYSDD